MRPVAMIAVDARFGRSRPTARTTRRRELEVAARMVRSMSIATARTAAGSRSGGSASLTACVFCDDVVGDVVDVVAADAAPSASRAGRRSPPGAPARASGGRRPGWRRWHRRGLARPRSRGTRRSSARTANAPPVPRVASCLRRPAPARATRARTETGAARTPRAYPSTCDGCRRQAPVRPDPERVPGRRSARTPPRRAARDGRGRGDRAGHAPARRAHHPPGLGDLRHAQARLPLDAGGRPRARRASRRGRRGDLDATPASRTTTSASTSSTSGSRWASRRRRGWASTARSSCSASWPRSRRSGRCRRCASSRSASTSTWSAAATRPPRRVRAEPVATAPPPDALDERDIAAVRALQRDLRAAARAVRRRPPRGTGSRCPSCCRRRPHASRRPGRCAASPPCSTTARPASRLQRHGRLEGARRADGRDRAADGRRSAACRTATSGRPIPTGRTTCSR